MKKTLLIGATLAFAAAYWLHDLSRQPQETAAQIEHGRPDTGLPAVSQSPGAAESDVTALDIGDDDGTEIVLGLRVRKDRNCTVELKDYVTPDGEMFSAYTCTPNSPRPPHPYATYTDEALEVMAYDDAEAASLLGKRLIERDTGRSYEMLIRAAALDSDFRHLAWLADQAFGATRINGEAQIENLKRQYELAAVSEYLGDVSGRTAYFRHELMSIGFAAEDFATLDDRVEQLVLAMREIQRDVHGEITMGGPSDA